MRVLRTHVADQAVRLIEAHLAQIALIGLLARVQAHVNVERQSRIEALEAILASNRTTTRKKATR